MLTESPDSVYDDTLRRLRLNFFATFARFYGSDRFLLTLEDFCFAEVTRICTTVVITLPMSAHAC